MNRFCAALILIVAGLVAGLYAREFGLIVGLETSLEIGVVLLLFGSLMIAALKWDTKHSQH